MADIADKARQIQEADIERAIANRRPFPHLKARGVCHWCDAPVGPRQLFCDSTCSDSFEREWSNGEIRYRDIK